MRAGGGIQGGREIGSTDKDGVEVKERPVTVPDLFATVYSAIGVDPKKKNISPLGRPISLSDNGVAVKELLT
jgi:arylsulfatase A-like enzyme